MRSKVTIVLLFLNVVLFYYIFHYEKTLLQDKATLEARKRVFGPEVAAIDSITRTSRAGPVLRLERRGEAWSLTQPLEWPADINAVEGLVKALQFLEHETSFAVADLAKSGQTLADYGLDHPAYTLGFTSAGKSYECKIGDDTKIGGRLYLLSPDGLRIHVVSRSLADSVGLSLDAFRSKAIFTVPVFEVNSVNVQTANLKVRLTRDAAARWDFETPIRARASKSGVELTINTLNALTARNFLENAGTDLERTGLISPFLRVTLVGNNRRETLLLGSAVGAGTAATPGAAPAPADTAGPAATDYYAKIEDKAAVFTVQIPNQLLEKLRSAQENLRDTRVLDFDPRTVTSLTLSSPNQPELTLQRLEAATDSTAWQVIVRTSGQAPQTIPADTAVVDDLLQKIYLLTATKFLTDAPTAVDLENYGFNRPERVIVLALDTHTGPRGVDASTLTLQIGVSPDQPGKAFARTKGLTFVYQIVPDILEETPVLARQYRQRLLRAPTEGARIQGFSLTDTATNTTLYAKQLTEAQASWDTAIATEPEARRRAILAALGQLHALRAKRFISDTFNPEHAETAQGPKPWKYRLDLNISFASGNGAAQNSTSTLFLTERLGGNTQLAGTAEFGGVVFEISQELLDALFTLAYREKNDPGAPVAAPVAPASDAGAPPAAPKLESPPR